MKKGRKKRKKEKKRIWREVFIDREHRRKTSGHKELLLRDKNNIFAWF